jgi:hydrogenase nickel incorporation protein HypA/HybF
MHELYLAQCIIGSVKKSLPPDVPGEWVAQVRVQVGKLDAVIPDTLTFLFDAIKSENGLPQATILVEEIPVRCSCTDCQQHFELDIPVFICPACGGNRIDVLSGKGILLTGITANDPEES